MFKSLKSKTLKVKIRANASKIKLAHMAHLFFILNGYQTNWLNYNFELFQFALSELFACPD